MENGEIVTTPDFQGTHCHPEDIFSTHHLMRVSAQPDESVIALLQKRIRVPAHPNSAMGAAILAAAGFHEEPVGKWSSRMVRILRTIEPSDSRMSYYRDRLAIFREHCYRGLP